MTPTGWRIATMVVLLTGSVPHLRSQESALQPLGLFTGSGDVGSPSTIGAGLGDLRRRNEDYTVSGGGENMWAARITSTTSGRRSPAT